MAYNKEDKITLEELSPSLQNLIKSAAKKSEINNLLERTNAISKLLSNSRFSVVDSLEDITMPINGKDIVVCKDESGYKLYYYYFGWNRIPVSTVDLNKEYSVVIRQSANQKIKVEYNGVFYTNSFKAKVNSNIKVIIIPSSGYIAGTLSCEEEFILTEKVTISATAATLIPKYNIIVQISDHQQIKITYKNKIYTNTSISNVLENDTFSVYNTADNEYIPGVLDVSDNSIHLHDSIYKIKGNTSISVTNASLNTYEVVIFGTQNQVIHFTYTNSETGVTTTQDIYTRYKSIILPYNSEYHVSIDGLNGYLPGTLSNTSGNITSDIEIEASPAIPTYNKEIFDSNGSFTWRAPNYITKVKVTLAGAGGGAHSEIIEPSSSTLGYYNGGNGELIESVLVPINTSTTYTIKVGKAGTTFASNGGVSTAFGITANGGSITGANAGNGLGGIGDHIDHLTGEIIYPAENGYVYIEYGTNIEREA